MKKIFLVPLASVLLLVFFASCFKNDGPKCTAYTEAQDRHVIDSFITANEQTDITFNSSDGYYKGVLASGSGSVAQDDSLITFDVVTRLLNGTVIDSVRYPLSGTIRYGDLNTSGHSYYNPGIYNGFSGVAEEGIFRVILLSRTQFGCSGAQLTNGKTIPPNSQIITDYKLVDVKKP